MWRVVCFGFLGFLLSYSAQLLAEGHPTPSSTCAQRLEALRDPVNPEALATSETTRIEKSATAALESAITASVAQIKLTEEPVAVFRQMVRESNYNDLLLTVINRWHEMQSCPALHDDSVIQGWQEALFQYLDKNQDKLPEGFDLKKARYWVLLTLAHLELRRYVAQIPAFVLGPDEATIPKEAFIRWLVLLSMIKDGRDYDGQNYRHRISAASKQIPKGIRIDSAIAFEHTAKLFWNSFIENVPQMQLNDDFALVGQEPFQTLLNELSQNLHPLTRVEKGASQSVQGRLRWALGDEVELPTDASLTPGDEDRTTHAASIAQLWGVAANGPGQPIKVDKDVRVLVKHYLEQYSESEVVGTTTDLDELLAQDPATAHALFVKLVQIVRKGKAPAAIASDIEEIQSGTQLSGDFLKNVDLGLRLSIVRDSLLGILCAVEMSESQKDDFKAVIKAVFIKQFAGLANADQFSQTLTKEQSQALKRIVNSLKPESKERIALETIIQEIRYLELRFQASVVELYQGWASWRQLNNAFEGTSPVGRDPKDPLTGRPLGFAEYLTRLVADTARAIGQEGLTIEMIEAYLRAIGASKEYDRRRNGSYGRHAHVLDWCVNVSRQIFNGLTYGLLRWLIPWDRMLSGRSRIAQLRMRLWSGKPKGKIKKNYAANPADFDEKVKALNADAELFLNARTGTRQWHGEGAEQLKKRAAELLEQIRTHFRRGVRKLNPFWWKAIRNAQATFSDVLLKNKAYPLMTFLLLNEMEAYPLLSGHLFFSLYQELYKKPTLLQTIGGWVGKGTGFLASYYTVKVILSFVPNIGEWIPWPHELWLTIRLFFTSFGI